MDTQFVADVTAAHIKSVLSQNDPSLVQDATVQYYIAGLTHVLQNPGANALQTLDMMWQVVQAIPMRTGGVERHSLGVESGVPLMMTAYAAQAHSPWLAAGRSAWRDRPTAKQWLHMLGVRTGSRCDFIVSSLTVPVTAALLSVGTATAVKIGGMEALVQTLSVFFYPVIKTIEGLGVFAEGVGRITGQAPSTYELLIRHSLLSHEEVIENSRGLSYVAIAASLYGIHRSVNSYLIREISCMMAAAWPGSNCLCPVERA